MIYTYTLLFVYVIFVFAPLPDTDMRVTVLSVYTGEKEDRKERVFNVQRFDDMVATYMRERRIPGASVAVGTDAQFLVRKGIGTPSANDNFHQ